MDLTNIIEAAIFIINSLKYVTHSVGKVRNFVLFTSLCVAMNKIELKRRWDEQQGKLKQEFKVLLNGDLLFAEGKEDEMLLRKQQLPERKLKKELHKKIIETL